MDKNDFILRPRYAVQFHVKYRLLTVCNMISHVLQDCSITLNTTIMHCAVITSEITSKWICYTRGIIVSCYIARVQEVIENCCISLHQYQTNRMCRYDSKDDVNSVLLHACHIARAPRNYTIAVYHFINIRLTVCAVMTAKIMSILHLPQSN